jgi:uncharacterized membrane protein
MPWTEERMDQAIGVLLRIGVTIAATAVLGGLVALALSHPAARTFAHFRGQPPQLRSAAGIVEGVRQGRAASWIELGLLLLIATPVARVVFTTFAFAARRDWTYVAISLIVLAILSYSLIRGAA